MEAPSKATDLSALVTELVARRTAAASGTSDDASILQSGVRRHRMFVPSGMRVSRGVRLYAWVQARSHLLPVVAGLAVTLIVVATWFRGPSETDQIDAGVVVVEPGDSGSVFGPASNAVEAHPPAMRLEARREVWVQFTVDGRQDSGRTLRAGDVEVISTGRDVAVRAGDAGALWVSVQGAAPEPLGPDGRVLTRNFTLGVPRGDASPGPVSTGGRGPEPAGGSAAQSPQGAAATAPPAATRPASAPPSNAPAGRAPASAARAPGAGGPPPEAHLVAAAESWFESYYRRLPYEAFGQSHRPSVSDSREPDARLPEGIWEVNRAFDDVQVQVVADTAIYSARMIERGQVGPEAATHAARVSLIWVRRNTGWQLMDVKLLNDPNARP